jgi:hypothetical protein
VTRRFGKANASGAGSVSIGGDANAPVSASFVDTQYVLGPSSVPVAVAAKDPSRVYSAADLDAFTGRDWLVRKVDRFLTDQSCGYVFIEADAGMGKTAFSAWLVKTRNYFSHFVRYSGASSQEVYCNLSAQLIGRFHLDNYAPGGMVPDWVQTPGGFEALIAAAAEAAEHERPVVIVIDGIDEAPPSGYPMPFGLPVLLPDGVFVIGTFRSGSWPGRPDSPAITMSINKDDPRNGEDIRSYLTRAANEEVLAPVLARAGMPSALLAEVLSVRCDGVWVYLRYVLQELRLGLRQPGAVADMPVGLWAYYADEVRGWRHDPAWDGELLPLLTALAVAGEALPVRTLARLAGGLDEGQVRRRCDITFRPFLTVIGGATGTPFQYEIYHSSFLDVVTGQHEALPTSNVEGQPYELRALTNELQRATLVAHERAAELYLNDFGGLDAGLPKLAAEPGLARIDHGYPLRHLARHLDKGCRREDLEELLRAESAPRNGQKVNVWFGAHDHADGIAAYLNDVARAQAVNGAATDEALARARAAPSLGAEFGYMLMAATITTRTFSIPLSLLDELIASSVWSLHRGLEHARSLADPSSRAHALVIVSRHMNAEDQVGILGEALAALTIITSDEDRVHILADLAPQLPIPLYGEALAAAVAITSDDSRAQALSDVAPYLPGDLHSQALDAAMALGSDRFRAQALTALVPYLDGEQRTRGLAQALVAATALADPNHDFDRAKALAALAPYIPEEVFALAIAEPDDFLREQVLGALAPYLPDELHAQALEIVQAFTRRPFGPIVVTALAPHLSETLQERVVDMASATPSNAERVHALTSLAPFLHGKQKARAIKEALDTANAVTSDHELAIVLTDLAPCLNSGRRTDVIARALAAIKNAGSAWLQFEGNQLVTLAPHLPPELQAQAVDVAAAITDEKSRAQTLTALAHHAAHEVQAQILAAATIADEQYRCQLVAEVAAHAPASLHTQVVAVANAISFAPYRALALALAAPHLGTTPRRTALVLALQAASEDMLDEYRVQLLAQLAPALTADLQAQAFDIAMIMRERRRTSGFIALALHLPKGERADALTRAVAAATASQKTYEDARVQALAALAGYLPPSEQTGVLAQILDVAAEVPLLGFLGRVIEWAAPHLSPELLRSALEAAVGIADDESRARALVALTPHLADELQARAMDMISTITTPEHRATALAEVAPRLPPELAPSTLTQALAAATGIKSGKEHARTLARLVPLLSKDLKLSAIEAALAAIASCQYDNQRAEALSALAPVLAQDPSADALTQALAVATQIGDDHSRAEALGALAPHVPRELRNATLAQALEAAAAIRHEATRGDALVALAPELPPKLHRQALAAATAIGKDYYRAWVLARMAPHLSPAWQARALSRAMKAAAATADDRERAQALAQLAPLVPAEAMTIATTIAEHHARVWALVEIAKYLPPQQRKDALAQALAAAAAITSNEARVHTLALLAPQMPPSRRRSLLKQALTAAALCSDEDKAHVLALIAPHLPPKLRAQALDTAVAIADDEARVKVLDALAPHMPAELLSTAIAAVPVGQPSTVNRLIGRAIAELSEVNDDQLLALLRSGLHYHGRQQFLEIVAPFASTIFRIGGASAVKTCIRAIEDVYNWWP